MELGPIQAVVVAGGQGSRLGDERPKQFLRLGSQEMVAYSVEAFTAHPLVDRVVLVVPAEYVDYCTQKYAVSEVVAGGTTRQESVRQGLSVCDKQGLVLVHDAARPFVSPQLIGSCIEALREYEGVVPVVPVVDSLISVSLGRIAPVDRQPLRRVQTPQAFHASLLWAAHETSHQATDELGLVLAYKPEARIKLIPGEEENFKITTAADLAFARSLKRLLR